MNNNDISCFTVNAICSAITMHYLMTSICTNESKLNLIELNEDEVSHVFNEHAFKLLQCLTHDAFVKEFENLNKDILDLIMGLSKDLDYWKTPENQSKVYFFIFWWLKGDVPPPRCSALLDGQLQCLNEAAKSAIYCHLLHSCQSNSCQNQREQHSKFCRQHNCEKNNCQSEKYNETNFCVKHICAACLLSHSETMNAREPFACAQHTCLANGCNKQQVYPFYGYCVDHVCTECAHTTTDTHWQRTNGTSLCDKHKCGVPRCEHKVFDESMKVCAYHLCRACHASKQTGAADPLCPESQLCPKHRCSKLTCLKPRLTASDFCSSHSCKECVSLKCAVVKPSINKAPRNSCLQHVLCEFVSNTGKLMF